MPRNNNSDAPEVQPMAQEVKSVDKTKIEKYARILADPHFDASTPYGAFLLLLAEDLGILADIEARRAQIQELQTFEVPQEVPA